MLSEKVKKWKNKIQTSKMCIIIQIMMRMKIQQNMSITKDKAWTS